MATKKVYIGVGHGGSDPGAVAFGFEEEDLNLDVAVACAEALMRSGLDVRISRTKDTDIWLEKRIKEANAFKADLAVDIHHNAGGGGGAEVYHSLVGGTGKKLAENILTEIVKIGQNSRGAKVKDVNKDGRDDFGFIRQTTMPAALVECAFIDNKKDLAIVDTLAERKVMGEAIAKGICKTLGVTFVAETKKPATSSDKIYRVQVGAYLNKQNATAMQKKLKAAGFDAVIV